MIFLGSLSGTSGELVLKLRRFFVLVLVLVLSEAVLVLVLLPLSSE